MAQKGISLKKNFVMNAILTMSQFIFPLITFPYVSRILLPEGTGKVSAATAFVAYFAMFAQLGIPTYGVRACAKVRDNKEELSRVVHELVAINLACTAISYFVYLIVIESVPRLRAERPLYLIVSCTMLFNAIGMEWLYKGLEKYSYITIRSIIFKFIAVIFMLLMIRDKEDYVVYGAISVFASSASGILNLINVRKYIILRPVGNYRFTRHLKAVSVFFAMSVATTVYTNLDKVMLSFMATDTDVGYYDAAVRAKTILVSVVTSLGTVLLPRASYYVEQNLMDEFRRITAKALRFVWIVALPMSLYFMLFATQVIGVLSGKAYGGAVVPMQIIMPTLLMIGLTNIMGIQMLVPLGREKVVLYSEIAGAIVDLILNILLIPRMQSAGAAIGTLTAELVVLIVQYIALRKDISSIIKQLPYGLTIAGVALGTLISYWSRSLYITDIQSFNSLFILVISAILFFGVYAGVLLIGREPMAWEVVGIVKRKLKRN